MQLKNYLLNGVVSGIGLTTVFLLGTPSVRAQVVPEAASEEAARQFDVDSTNDLDNVFNGRDTNGSSVLNLINKLQDLNYYTPTPQEQVEGINGAVQDFHRKRRERLQAPSVGSPDAAPLETE